MNCHFNGCKCEATHVPMLMVPALGWSIDLHQPIGMVLGIELCEEHTQKFDAKEFVQLNPHIKAMVHAVLAGKCPADFNRAFVQPVAIDSDEYRAMDKGRAASRKAST